MDSMSTTLRLLRHVRQFMCQQPLARAGIRRILSLAEYHVRPDRICKRINRV